ncbi:hypothetical protein GCM10018954_091370 [Kutzneria kofuensis]
MGLSPHTPRQGGLRPPAPPFGLGFAVAHRAGSLRIARARDSAACTLQSGLLRIALRSWV